MSSHRSLKDDGNSDLSHQLLQGSSLSERSCGSSSSLPDRFWRKCPSPGIGWKLKEPPRNKIGWILTTRQSLWLDDHRSGTWKEHEMACCLWIKHHISWILLVLKSFQGTQNHALKTHNRNVPSPPGAWPMTQLAHRSHMLISAVFSHVSYQY